MLRISWWRAWRIAAVVAFAFTAVASSEVHPSGGGRQQLIAETDLEWTATEYPLGASAARLGLPFQHLVRWPSGAGLPSHIRRQPWQGIVLKGSVAFRIADEVTVLGPLSYFVVQADVPVAASCDAASGCEFIGHFSTADSIKEWREADGMQADVPIIFSHLFVELTAAEWVRAAPGVQFGTVPRGNGSDKALLLGMNAFWPYKVNRQGMLPARPGGSGTFMGFVLAGCMVIGTKKLGPGGFFMSDEPSTFSAHCQEAECVVVTTEAALPPTALDLKTGWPVATRPPGS